MFNKIIFWVFLLYLALLTRSVETLCDPNPSTNVFIDPFNPYCTKLFGSECTCCGNEGDNLVTYNSKCTVANPNDLVVGEHIIKRCDSNCDDGSCQNGICKKCKSIGNNKFYLLENSDNGSINTSCVPRCDHYQGFFSNSQNDSCLKCPLFCSSCTTNNMCQECEYQRVRLINGENFSKSIDCTKHSSRITLSTEDVRYIRKFYISPMDQDCSSIEMCDGSLQKPYNNINLVFKDLIENVKIGQYTRLRIEIYLLKDNTNYQHFWLEDDSLPMYYKRLFERTLVDAVIQPLVCDDVTKCFSDNEKATIYIKSNFISIFVTWKLHIKNIVFDASELIPDGTCYNSYKSSKLRCCDSSGEYPSKTNPETDALCNPTLSQGPLLHPFLNFEPSISLWPKGPYSFINLQMIIDIKDTEVPELIIEGCEFNHFWYHRFARSLINLDEHASRITITNTFFSNFHFPYGLITNAFESIQRDTLFTEGVISNYDCSKINPSLSECFSLKIESSSFKNSLFQDFSYSKEVNQFNQADSLNYRVLPKNEGIVLFLVSFKGPISIVGNTFEKLASLFFSSPISSDTPISCTASSRVTVSSLYHSLDRLVQVELGHEKMKNVQSSSVINIRNLQRGITFYNNIFRNNLALTGTNLLIHQFDNTLNYPIIIQQNLFEGNLAQIFGSSFAIINYERDYVNMDCHGVYLKDNTFKDNIMCPNAIGNAIVVCIPEKMLHNPFFSEISENPTYSESSFWIQYYPSTNQETDPSNTDYNIITQLVFTKFVNYITENKETVNPVNHPITGEVIDTSRIQVFANTFMNNYASLAQLYIQGAFNIDVQRNQFQDNSFPFPILYPDSLTSYPIFAKVLAGKQSGYIVSSAFMTRLINYANIKDNTFTNNQQVATTSPALTVGTALSIDRHLGAAPVVISNNKFNNHLGLDYAKIRSLDTYQKSADAPTIVDNLEKGTIQPLITYSIWNKFEGLSYKETILPQDEFDQDTDTTTQNSIDQVLFVNATLNISACSFEGNVFNANGGNRSAFGDSRAIFWYFTDDNREYNGLALIGNSDGQVILKTNLYIEDSSFLSNKNLDSRSFLKLTNFNFFSIKRNIFRSNSIAVSSTQSEVSFIELKYTEQYQPEAQLSDNTWENNFGKILYISESGNAQTKGSTIFSTNQINHHISPNNVLSIISKTNINITNIIAEDITVEDSFLNLVDMKSDVNIENVSINTIKSSKNGCLVIDRLSSGFQLDNVICKNSQITIPTFLDAKNSEALTPCFNIQNQAANSVLTSNSLKCESPMIIYSNREILLSATVKAQCLYFANLNSISITDFSCVNAGFDESIKDDNLVLGEIIMTSSVRFSNSQFENNKAYHPFYQSNGKMIFRNTTIRGNSAKILSSFLYLMKTSLQFTSVVFDSNICENCPAGIINLQGTITASGSTFMNNVARKAPVFNIKIGSLRLSSSNFTKNKALQESSVILSDASTVTVDKCYFEENQSEADVFTVSEGTITISNSKFVNNLAIGTGTHGVSTSGATLKISNSSFSVEEKKVNCLKGMFVSVEKGQATITNSNFTNGYAKIGGAIYFELTSYKPTITGCTFTLNSAMSGGAIFIEGTNSRIIAAISSCTFDRNQAEQVGGSISIIRGMSSILNSSFLTATGHTLYFEQGTHTLDNLVCKGSRDIQSEGQNSNSIGAVFFSVRSLQITDSYFSDFYFDKLNEPKDSNLPVSALVLQPEGSSTSCVIKNVTFERNIGKLGGAIYAEDKVDITISNSTFQGNRAEQGGAIYYSSIYKTSDFIIKGSCLFSDNTAIKSGGAIQYTGRKVTLNDNQIVFTGNSAPYGNDFGAYGVYLVQTKFDPIIFEAYKEYITTSTSDWRRLLQEINTNSTINIYDQNYKSGTIMDPPLMYELRDEYGTVVTIDNNSAIKLDIESSGNTSIKGAFQGDTAYYAFNGYFVVYPLRVFVGPNNDIQINANLSSFNATLLGRSFDEFKNMPKTNPIIVPSRPCNYGERLTDSGTCYLCPKGQYTFLAGETDPCIACPNEGVCDGGNVFGPNFKYWRFSPLDHKITECLNDEACLGAYIQDKSLRERSYCPANALYNESFCLMGWCNEGYQGILCSECNDGWAISNSLSGTCSQCSNNPKYYIISVLLAIAGTIYILFLIKSAIKNDPKSSNNKEVEKKDEEIRQLETIQLDNIEAKKGEISKVNISNHRENINDRNFEEVVSLAEIVENKNSNDPRYIETKVNSRTHLKSQDLSQKQAVNIDSKTSLKSGKIENDEKKTNPSSNSLQDNQNNKDPVTKAYPKILTSYIQIIGLLGTFNFEWPQEQQDFFKSQQSISRGSTEVFSFDCVLRQPFFAGMNLRPFFTKLFTLSLSPVIFFAIIIFVWTVMYKIKYRKNFKALKDRLKTNIITSCVVVLFLVHPNIVQLSIQAFQCLNIGDAADSNYLRVDLQIKCDTPQHSRLAYSVALPSLIVWGAGIPIFAFIILFIYRKRLNEDQIKAKFGFLYEGYRGKHFYWEMIILYRKLAVILISTFMDSLGVMLQAAVAFGLCTGFYLLQIKIKPYKTSALNELEKRSLIVSSLTLYCAMFYVTRLISINTKIVLFVFVVLINLYFVVHWFVEFMRVKSEELLKIPFMEKHFGKILRKFQTFHWISRKRQLYWRTKLLGNTFDHEKIESKNEINLTENKKKLNQKEPNSAVEKIMKEENNLATSLEIKPLDIIIKERSVGLE